MVTDETKYETKVSNILCTNFLRSRRGSKHAFWQALILTVVVFGLGVMLGFFLEGQKTDRASDDVISSEIRIIDEQLRNKIINNFDVSCDLAKKSTFDFADDIFEEARRLEKYDASSTFTNDLESLHRRYDLLRALLWSQAVETKKKCGDNFHTVVYLYEYATEDVGKRSEQVYFSRLLTDLKAGNPSEVLLIPIAANMNLASVDILLEEHGVESLPAIVVDEKEVINNRISIWDLQDIVFE